MQPTPGGSTRTGIWKSEINADVATGGVEVDNMDVDLNGNGTALGFADTEVNTEDLFYAAVDGVVDEMEAVEISTLTLWDVGGDFDARARLKRRVVRRKGMAPVTKPCLRINMGVGIAQEAA